MKRSLVVVGLVVGLAAVTSSASAEEKGPIRTREVEIVGRVKKPVVAVVVSKVRPVLGLADLAQPVVERTEAPTQRDPF